MLPASGKRRRSDSEEAQFADAVAEATAAAIGAATAAATAAAAAASAAAAAAASKREEDYMCSICMNLLSSPCGTPCGHCFCLGCLKESLKSRAKCPLCNASVSATLPLAVNKIIEASIEANAGPLFLARKTGATQIFLDKLVALDPKGALAELNGFVDCTRFVGDATKRMTPLLWVCSHAKGDSCVEWIALAKALIARPGVDLKAQCAEGRGALSHVASSGFTNPIGELIPLLYDKGLRDKDALGRVLWFKWGNIDVQQWPTFVSAVTLLAEDDSVTTSSIADPAEELTNALRNGFDDASVALLKKGFRTTPLNDALRFAASGGCAASIKLLCKGPIPLVPVDTVFECKKTALHIACGRGRADAALALLECGASVFTSDEYFVKPAA